MHIPLTLKQWAEGQEPKESNIYDWSNLLYQRSIQLQGISPEEDNVSQYFLEQFLISANSENKSTVSKIFDTTFSMYSARSRHEFLKTLAATGSIELNTLLDNIRPRSDIRHYLLTQTDTWRALSKEQYNCYLKEELRNSFFNRRTQSSWSEHGPDIVRACLETLSEKTLPEERDKLYRQVILPSILQEWRFLHGEYDEALPEDFHSFLNDLSTSWSISPAPLMLILLQEISRPMLHRFEKYLEPYLADLHAILEFGTTPKDIYLREQLPATNTIATIDQAIVFSSILNPLNLLSTPGNELSVSYPSMDSSLFECDSPLI